MKTIISIIIAIIISVSAMAAPSKAEAWVWFVAKKILSKSKPMKVEPKKREWVRPPAKQSETRYQGSNRESRYRRF